MKKLLLTLTFICFIQIGAWAQYTFTKSTGTYTNLTGSTVVSFLGWDEQEYVIPIGFPFTIGGLTYTNLTIYANGQLNFKTPTTTLKGVFGFDADLMDRGGLATLSPISYLTTGTAGNRITKVEWKNAGFYDYVNSMPSNAYPFPNDFINFQVWIYEGSNKIEVRIGSLSISTRNITDNFGPTGGPTIGVITNVLSAPSRYSGIVLQGPAANPSPLTLTSSTTIPQLTGIPTNGTIYAFTPAATGITRNLSNAAISLYPNPASDVVTVEGLPSAKAPAIIKVMDVLGKVVLTESLNKNNQVNISSLTRGTYFIEVTNGTEQFSKHLIKQ